MEDNRINELMEATVNRMQALADADTIIGKPITTPDGITLIPVSRVSFGFATGGTSGSKGVSFSGANGGGVKIEPMGFFVVKDGNCRMIGINPPASGTFDRLVEMLPDLLDRIEGMTKKDE